MKEATGELNMTLITIIAAAIIGTLLFPWIREVINTMKDDWKKEREKQQNLTSYIEYVDYDLDYFGYR